MFLRHLRADDFALRGKRRYVEYYRLILILYLEYPECFHTCSLTIFFMKGKVAWKLEYHEKVIRVSVTLS